MNYIIISKFGIPSIKSIFDNLNDVRIIKKFNNGWRRLVERNSDTSIWSKITTPVFNNTDKILRWGATTIINPNSATIINKSEAISLASNKYEARMKMRECSVPIPETFFDANEIDIHGYPLIVRPMKHSKGKDFFIIDDDMDLWNWIKTNGKIPYNRYFSKIYNKQREVRVHVAHGKILSIHEKKLVESIIQANQAQTHEPWKILKWSEYEKDVCKVACDAVKALGLDYGAVDVMIDRRNTEMPVCVCEVNTAPSLDSSPYDQKRYSAYINWLFRSNREWYKYEEWNKPESFAFKNFQLEE